MEMRADDIGTVKAIIQGGVLNRGQLKEAALGLAWSYGVEAQVTEDKRWSGSTYYFTFTGERDKILPFIEHWNRWVERLNKEAS